MSASDPAHLDIILKIAGAVVGPLAGLVGTRIKRTIDRRDKSAGKRQLIAETGHLIEFGTMLQKSSDLHGDSDVFDKARATLQKALDQKLAEFVVAFAPTQITTTTTAVRSRFDRLFLLYRPVRSWGWILHILYYAMIGVVLLGSLGLWADRSAGDVTDGIIGLSLFLLVAVVANLGANRLDKRLGMADQTNAHNASRSRTEIFVQIMFVLSILFAGVWIVVQLVFGVSKSLYEYSEGAWLVCLPVVFYGWRVALQSCPSASGLSTNRARGAHVAVWIAFAILLGVFLLTIAKASQGSFPLYSIWVRGTAFLFSCMAVASCMKSLRSTRDLSVS
jgi:hypothetical protein